MKLHENALIGATLLALSEHFIERATFTMKAEGGFWWLVRPMSGEFVRFTPGNEPGEFLSDYSTSLEHVLPEVFMLADHLQGVLFGGE
jgi:hypothetical protein